MTNPEKHKLMFGFEYDPSKYINKPPLLPPFSRMIWKVPVQGISNIILLESDLDNTRGKNRKKQNLNLKGKSCTPELNENPLDWNNTQRDCTNRYGQAPQKITDPLEAFFIHQS